MDTQVTGPEEWFRANRENWDERVGIHLASQDYDVSSLKAGAKRLDPLVERHVGEVANLKVLHLLCHFGSDSLVLAQRGADVTGLDFSGEAIRAARMLNADFVFVTWGAICALLGQGLLIEAFEEHDAVLWQAFSCLRKDADGLYRFADRPWLPLSYSLIARHPADQNQLAPAGHSR
jgi:hypothetical protein